MICSFRGRRSTLETSDVILRGRHSNLDASCCVFLCESHCQCCAKWRQRANSVAGVAFCDMWWKLTEALHETSILRSVHKKTRGKTCVLKLQSVKIWGSLAWNARFDAPTGLVFESLAFHVASPCLWGEAAKPILFAGVKASCNVVLCGRRGTSWHFHASANASKIVLCGKRNTFASLSKDDWQFSWQAQHFGDLRCHFAWQAQQFRRVVLRFFVRIALSVLREVATTCKFRGRRGLLWHVMKIDGSLARNVDFEVGS